STDQNPSFTFPANGDYPVSLIVTNSAGTSQPFTQTIAVSGNIVAPTAGFTPNSADGITFQFTDTSQPVGTITNWSWDFGGAGSSTDQNPSFTFPANGDYPVSLIVTNRAGTSQPFSQTITVGGIATAPVASFTSASADGITFQLTDTSQPVGSILTWFWDFGRIGSSTEQNPVVTFPVNGDFPVTLTVTSTGGTSQPFGQTITVTGHGDTPPPDDDSIADTTPVLPDMDQTARILQRYVDTSKDAAIFGLTGDNSIRQDGFLKPFGDGQYTLDNDSEGLRATIDAYVGTGAFTRESVAVNADYLITNLLNDSPDGCNGENLFQCEITQSNSNIIVISIGLRDVQNGTDPEAFRADFNTLLQSAIDRGVAPVVLTIYPRPGSEDAIKAINEVIIEVANDRQAPVINIWRAFNEIGASALDGNNPSVGGGDADVITADTINTFGENTRNYLLLTVLSQIRQLVLGQS
ncbi:MAG: PKD domain-containing protein, partial [Anaerolineae bacterium]|nr:PKD domain-containing protein [Anaerolineae bacterium]